MWATVRRSLARPHRARRPCPAGRPAARLVTARVISPYRDVLDLRRHQPFRRPLLPRVRIGPRRLPDCGATNPAGARFCGTAGRTSARHASWRPLPAADDDRRAEARRAPRNGGSSSVLFADLVGFTTLSADRDPEIDARAPGPVLRAHPGDRRSIRRRHREVHRRCGDGDVGRPGRPRGRRRARRPGRPRPRRHGPGARAARPTWTSRSASASSPARRRSTRRRRGSGHGHGRPREHGGTAPVGRAGRAACSSARRRGSAAEAAIEFVAAGDQELKGKPAPVPAWLAVRVVGERGGARRPDALEPPFVGRTDELRFLKEQFHATGRERRARLVSLVGQAGIGKSRLAWELEKYLDGVVEQVWWHRGRSPSYGEGVTFWALGEMIRRRAGLAEGDDEEATRAAVAAMLRRTSPTRRSGPGSSPGILVLLGIGESPPGGRTELFAAWRTFFERLAETRHGRLRRRGPPVVGRRPARLPRAPPRLGPIQPDLRPDPRPAGAPRAPSRLGHRSPGRDLHAPRPADRCRHARAPRRASCRACRRRSSSRILERADGIPLYAVETIRMLVASGRLVQEGGDSSPRASRSAPPTWARSRCRRRSTPSSRRASTPVAGRSVDPPGRGRPRPDLHPRGAGRDLRRDDGRRSSHASTSSSGARS